MISKVIWEMHQCAKFQDRTSFLFKRLLNEIKDCDLVISCQGHQYLTNIHVVASKYVPHRCYSYLAEISFNQLVPFRNESSESNAIDRK